MTTQRLEEEQRFRIIINSGARVRGVTVRPRGVAGPHPSVYFRQRNKLAPRGSLNYLRHVFVKAKSISAPLLVSDSRRFMARACFVVFSIPPSTHSRISSPWGDSCVRVFVFVGEQLPPVTDAN